MYPKIEINLRKIEDNTKKLVEMCQKIGIKIAGVTKMCCGNLEIARVLVNAGVAMLADSRIENLKKLYTLPVPKLLLRIPMLSEVSEVIKWSDISLVSELETIKALGAKARSLGKEHPIILMVDLGDLREGIWPDEVEYITKEIKKIQGIKIIGIATNFTCFGGILPTRDNLSELLIISKIVEDILCYKLEYIGGGNSSTLYLLENGEIPKGINLLRIGEAIMLGRETAYGKPMKELWDDAFVLKVEIIEIKEKPSAPIGNIGMDAFGNKPIFIDKGIRLRAIGAIGKQDVDINGLIPFDNRVEIIGGSSDHLLLDLTNTEGDYTLGDIVSFKVNYGALLALMTSPYVKKDYL